FESNYMITQEQYIPEANANGLVRQPVYSELKDLLFWIFTGGLLVWLIVVLAVSHFHAKTEVRKAVTKLSKTIHEFMQSEKDAADLFPKEYAAISTQMVEIKSIMRQHEQILKDEANRKNDLIAYLAPDLKTPLTSVIGYLSLLG